MIDKQALLEQCRKFVFAPGEVVKTAGLGGDGQDSTFEQSFANLAHAYLRDKAPSLLDHQLGFQLLDRNEDNTKAVGIFAFRVGSQLLYAPCFFIDGELKGHELLYNKSQDMFMPLKENWLNYIMNRKPAIIGAGVSRQLSRLGLSPPNLSRLSSAPMKFASAKDVEDFLPVYGHLCTTEFADMVSETQRHFQEKLDLPTFLKSASVAAVRAFTELLQERPAIAAAFDKWHGIATLEKIAKYVVSRGDQPSILADLAVIKNQKQAANDDSGPDIKNKVEIVTLGTSFATPAETLTDSEREQLLKDEVLIKDRRTGEEVSTTVNQTVAQQYANPTVTGIYQVLTAPGEFKKCLVVIGPHDCDGPQRNCVVVDLSSDSHNYACYPSQNVFVSQDDADVLNDNEQAWQDWLNTLPDADGSEDGTFLFVGPRRQGTVVFDVADRVAGGDANVRRCWSRCYGDTHSALGYARYYPTNYQDNADSGHNRLYFGVTRGKQLLSHGDSLDIPGNFKALRVGDSSLNIVGRALDLQLDIFQKTAALRVLARDNVFSVNQSQPLTKVAALVHLVREHGFTESVARGILQQAEKKAALLETFECRVKYANPYLTQGAPAAPAFPEMTPSGYDPMGFSGETRTPDAQAVPVTDMSAHNNDLSMYNVNPAYGPFAPMDRQVINQATQTNQREVFDTSVISSMLRSMRDDTMIDRYIPDIVKGMDRIGRILFMFYWHHDKFADRYGRQDTPELEDSLRNALEILGDVVLFLKQKTIEPYPEENAQDADLSAAASL